MLPGVMECWKMSHPVSERDPVLQLSIIPAIPTVLCEFQLRNLRLNQINFHNSHLFHSMISPKADYVITKKNVLHIPPCIILK